jgi:MraZ protein
VEGYGELSHRGEDEMTFSGQSQPKLDEKGRLILPAKWREALGDGVYLTKGQDRCVSLYTATEFSKISERLEAARQTTKAARFFVRNFMASAESEAPDKQGRITIPGHLREYAGLGRDLILAGVNNRIEIWDLATWNNFMAEQDAEFADLDEEVIPGIF